MSLRNSWINKLKLQILGMPNEFVQAVLSYRLSNGFTYLIFLVAYLLPSLISLQDFKLTSNGSVVVLDWFTAGRMALGEVWDMTR